MSQSGFIAALLLAAFVLFLASRNRLVTYASVLWGATGKPIAQAPATKSGGTDIIGTAGSVLEGAAVLGVL